VDLDSVERGLLSRRSGHSRYPGGSEDAEGPTLSAQCDGFTQEEEGATN